MIDALHNIVHFKKWKPESKRRIAAATGQPQTSFQWACEIETANSWRDLSDSGQLPITDLNLASAISEIRSGAVRNNTNLAEEEMEKANRMLNGRQMMWIFYDGNQIASVDKSIADWNTLLECRYKKR